MALRDQQRGMRVSAGPRRPVRTVVRHRFDAVTAAQTEPAEETPTAGTTSEIVPQDRTRRSAAARERTPARWVRKPRLTRSATRNDQPAPKRQAESRAALRGSRLAVAALAVALVVAVVALGMFGRQWYQQRQADTGRQHALAAARQVTVNFVSISATSVDSDLQRIVAGATGDFKDEFTRDMAQVRSAVVENKVESHGTVLRAAIVSAARHSAVVLVALDATVKNTNAPDGRLSHYRIQVSMTLDAGSGRWLVSQLQFVG